MKTVLFVPGYQEDINSRDYASVISAIESNGYVVEFVPIAWRRTTINDWTAQLDAIYGTYDPGDVILAGFSLGAVTAFVSAAKRQPHALWLFSLSSRFAEDLRTQKAQDIVRVYLGSRRLNAFIKLDFKGLAAKIRCRVLIFAGEQELVQWPDMATRATQAHRVLHDSTYVIVPGAGHNVADKNYLVMISANI